MFLITTDGEKQLKREGEKNRPIDGEIRNGEIEKQRN